MISRRTARGALAVIVFAAASLRIFYFVGFVGGDPQDDFLYYSSAYALYADGNTQLHRLRDQPEDWLPNPVDQFILRPMVTYPIAALFAVFGPDDAVAALWGLLCSLVTVVVVYRIGEVLHDRAVGLLGAALCTIYPLEVINATRILSDVQLGMFVAVAVLMLVEGDWYASLWRYGFSGAAVACAYLANPRALVVLPLLVVCALLQGRSAPERAPWRAALAVLAGFLVVFSIEAVIYSALVGDPFLSYRTQAGASYFKYLHEPVASVDWPWLKISYTNGRPFDLIQGVFGFSQRVNQFGWFFFLFLAAATYSLLRRRNLVLLILGIGLFMFMEFGAIKVELDRITGKLHYLMVFKQDRFLLVVTAPFLVLSAYLLRSVGKRSGLAVVVMVVLLWGSSLNAISETHAVYRAGLNDLRVVADDIRRYRQRTYFAEDRKSVV